MMYATCYENQGPDGDPQGDCRRRSGSKPAEAPAFTKLLTGGELLALDLKPRFLVRGVLVEGQPMIIGGRSKTMKTSALLLTWPSVLAAARRFLAGLTPSGYAWVSGRARAGRPTIRETAQRIAAAKGVDLADCSVWWCFDLPQLSHVDHLDHLRATIDGTGCRWRSSTRSIWRC